ncbi:MAG: hypothetical protein A2X47_12980 [Lentisphaerae bacterium GWF2_38_69]|nr:MAG: hypothetical protein A2X47_12980 [Lentisphaerae bacterium GWF2_38_69]
MIKGKLKDVSLKVTTEAEAIEKIKTDYLPFLNAKTKEQLESALKWQSDEYALPKIAERYNRNPDGIRVDTMKVFKFSGLETSEDKGNLQRQKNICRYGFHSFRHSFASIMASNGYNITMLAQVLADDTKTLEKYYINIDDKVIKNTFDDLFSSSLMSHSNIGSNALIQNIRNQLQSMTTRELEDILEYIKNLK